ncbi:Uu.00g034060.m01.CDS01 [Anthostomella pinea]|uniref:Uu.00g034060.m01.CDS01 n=1 Tax=Anthostomella pinea TaxID=933095 RepID=A0AAI8YDG6_9PEZI|nr:Uu.00g034060.m01.CDS01 [Anthostomella pinea]
MQFSTAITGTLFLAGSALTSSQSLPTIRSEDLTIPNGSDDFITAYFNPTTNDTTTSGTMSDQSYSDTVPLWELPDCYRECINRNCCIGTGLKDVRKLSIQDFCWSKQYWVETWMLDHLAYCVGPTCKSCRPQCEDNSTTWMKRVCHRG